MYRIAFAGFSHETNTFSPLPTTYEVLTRKGGAGRGLLDGEDIAKFRGKPFNHGFSGFYSIADPSVYEIVPLVFSSATPSGLVNRAGFDKVVDLICSQLEENKPLDGVYLALHGAMVVEGYIDGETEIVRRVREVVGDIPVVVSLDLHGNITAECVELASALVGFRTYPHVDVYETGERCAKVMQYLLEGKPLAKAYRMLPFIIPISSMSTNTLPAKKLYELVDELETAPGMVSVSFMEGFPPADIPHAGPSIFTYGETSEAAEEAAQKLYDAVLKKEEEFKTRMIDYKDGVKKAKILAAGYNKPVIIADVQDNAGAGSTSDTAWLVQELVEQGAENAAVGLMFDPDAAAAAHQAGEGAAIQIGLGGKLTPGQQPYEADYKVLKLFEGDFPATGPMGKGRITNLGKMALLGVGGVQVAVSSVRTQALDQSYFRVLGVEPSDKGILVLKSSNHYRADFEPISSEIIQVAAPAAMIDDPVDIPYTNLRAGVRLGGNGPEYKSSK